MKNKKFKLFASLTSLVMVVAVMAVGVWAATAATVGITGTVSLTSTNARATITTSAVSVEGAQLAAGSTTEQKSVTLQGIANEEVDLTLGALVIDSEQVSAATITVYYTVTIQNTDTKNKITVTVTAHDATVYNADAYASQGMAEVTQAFDIAKSGTDTLVVAVSAPSTADFSKNIGIELSLVASAQA